MGVLQRQRVLPVGSGGATVPAVGFIPDYLAALQKDRPGTYGTLTVTPARALMWRRPTLLAIIAQAKANAEASASRSVNAGASVATSDPFPGAPAAS